jgi:hypothetical protein
MVENKFEKDGTNKVIALLTGSSQTNDDIYNSI